MGRKRIHNRTLPRRLYLKCGSYYFVHSDGRWQNLGHDLGEAVRQWGVLMQAKFSVSTMNDLFDRYQAEIIPQKRPKTQKTNMEELKRLRPVFGDSTPTAITSQMIYQYLDRRTAKVRANREISLLSHVFEKAIRWGVVTANPCRGVERNKETPRDRDVSDAEYQAVYSLALPSIQIAMDLARVTGMREGNILQLKLSDWQDDGLHVTLNKGGKPVIYERTQKLEKIIERAKKLRRRIGSIFLLSTRNGTPYTGDGFRSGWNRAMKKALAKGLIKESFTFHDLRALAAAESDDPTNLLGHSDRRITEKVYLRRPRRVKPNG